ncbi:unnamed protein product [Spirodela intermedia]|uniref:Sugar phosphate transporter domain-containing protein n=1 Tax=Spirodela intermedia TaxID=51605 RepID=A0A7I8JPU4_SPIIN|nr:unnamed protein product [Spirodela intermedia]CAA6671452.1 unnamed protein product [Spirodela intermedia]
MRDAVLTIPPATRAAIDGRVHSRRCGIPSHRFSSVAFGLARTIARLTSIDGVSGHDHRRPALFANFSSSGPKTGCEINLPPSTAGTRNSKSGRLRFRRARREQLGTGGCKSAGGSLMKTLYVGVLVALWYLFNIYFNIYNKQVLKVYPYPVTITTAQFAVGTVFVLFSWATNIIKRPKITSSQLLVMVPLAIAHTLGNLFTNMSLGKVAVSFTHTIKAMEPFFSVFLSAMFLGETPTLPVVLSLAPVVGGVVLASLTEASFNWIGFWSAMASNLTNQGRNVVSKKLMDQKESLDNMTIFSIITVMSFLLMVPVTPLMEGIKFTPSFLQSAGLDVKEVFVRSLLAAIYYHAYQQLSYMILAYMSPVTHSVANCVKRVVVIVSAVLFFSTPVSRVNALGTAIALAGVFLYSRVTKLRPKKPKSA